MRRQIIAAKQKLIFYISFVKSEQHWRPDEVLFVDEFVELFANDKMYQKISKSEKDHLKKALMKSKLIVKEQ